MEKKAAITGIGMISAIGHNVETACASIRCGLRRFGETGHATLDPVTLEDIPVPASAIAGITDGYQGVGLYSRIGQYSLKDLIRYGKLNKDDNYFWGNTHFILCVSPTRANESTTPDIDFNKALDNIIQMSGLNIPQPNRSICEYGHAAVLFGIEKGMQLLSRKQVDRVLVLGVDSLVGEEELNFYQHRLKSDETGDGLGPGQAGAAVLIENVTTAKNRNADIHGYIGAVFTDRSNNNRIDQKTELGSGLAKVITKSLNEAIGVNAYYCDLNGEKQRAQEWGYAVPKIRMEIDNFPEIMRAPAECIGDTGAVSGAVSICGAVRSFARKYNPGKDILVWASSDNGMVASAIIQKKESGEES